MSYLITFEGIDGSGKSTQVELLSKWFAEREIPYICTREPGGTKLGKEIRTMLLSRTDLNISPRTEELLFQADRAQHFHEIVIPALTGGTIVISDRCFDSTLVYQADIASFHDIYHQSLFATRGRSPDLTFLLDLDPQSVDARLSSRLNNNKFDQKDSQWYQNLAKEFRQYANHISRERIKVIDADRSKEEVHQDVLQYVRQLLAAKEN
jgi:dTMP kinase